MATIPFKGRDNNETKIIYGKIEGNASAIAVISSENEEFQEAWILFVDEDGNINKKIHKNKKRKQLH